MGPVTEYISDCSYGGWKEGCARVACEEEAARLERLGPCEGSLACCEGCWEQRKDEPASVKCVDCGSFKHAVLLHRTRASERARRNERESAYRGKAPLVHHAPDVLLLRKLFNRLAGKAHVPVELGISFALFVERSLLTRFALAQVRRVRSLSASLGRKADEDHARSSALEDSWGRWE